MNGVELKEYIQSSAVTATERNKWCQTDNVRLINQQRVII